jgi:hypothetical protein
MEGSLFRSARMKTPSLGAGIIPKPLSKHGKKFDVFFKVAGLPITPGMRT